MSEAKSMTRLARARIIRDQVVEIGHTRGRWASLDLDDGRTARVWEIDGDGWTASITTRFSGLPREVVARDYDEAVLLQLAPPNSDDLLVDVYHPEAGKVLSLGQTGDVDTLIGMQAGPWEASFGLPARDWSPAIARRLERLKSNGRARFAS